VKDLRLLLQSRSPSPNYDPINELKISGLLNSALEKVLDFEGWLIKLGISFPLGGSLFIIVYKKLIQ
jgi:hypothetical protein